ncbi:hypothetical protein Emed_000331 [Eimeria media]
MEHTKKTQATYTSQNGVYCSQFLSVFQHVSVGAVTELDNNQYLVALTPAVTREFVQNGHTVYFQAGFATRAGFTDQQYKQAGAHMLNTAEEVYKKSNIIVKVNPPQESEFSCIQPQQVIFCMLTTTMMSQQQQQQFLQMMTERKATIINYNTLMNNTSVNATGPSFPVHNAMCEVTGYLGVQQAMNLTGATTNGTLFGQVAGIPGANVLILGAGACGTRAATLAAATGAQVTVMDTNTEALRHISQTLPTVQTLQYTQQNLEQTLPTVNTLIGCVIPTTYTQAPTLVTDAQLQMMQQGSIAIDLAASAGGNFQATNLTTIQKPTYNWNGITMYTATNIACLAPQTTSCAFSLSAMPYLLQVANKGWKRAVIEFYGLQEGVVTAEGCVTNTQLATNTQFKFTPIEQVLENEIQQIGNTQQQLNIVNLKQQLNTFRSQQTTFTISA